jgi:hypothetical protein
MIRSSLLLALVVTMVGCDHSRKTNLLCRETVKDMRWLLQLAPSGEATMRAIDDRRHNYRATLAFGVSRQGRFAPTAALYSLRFDDHYEKGEHFQPLEMNISRFNGTGLLKIYPDTGLGDHRDIVCEPAPPPKL